MSDNFFKWDSEFNTGNTQIDEQHFQLVKIINQMVEISINNSPISLDSIISISQKLSDYVINHFSAEETLMKKHQIDKRHSEIHLQYHKSFVTEIKNIFENPIELQNHKKLQESVEYLIRWLAYHILSVDKSLVRQLNYISENQMSSPDAYEKDMQTTEASTEPFLKALKVLFLIVSKKNIEIEHKNKELERKVEMRTLELSQANDKLRQLLYHDTLTELPNRRFVMKELDKLIATWKRYKTPFSILFLDLDKFKAVNDLHGHDSGDEVLKWVANFFNTNIRETDIACRLGGDEFVIICSNTNLEGAVALGSKLNKLCQMDKNTLQFWRPSFSIGVSTYNSDLTSSSDILKDADSAMYISKTMGGNLTTASQSS